MNTEENKNVEKNVEESKVVKENKKEKQTNTEPIKREKSERNNSKRTGMPFGFDELFFKCDHHFVE